jgi:hypothetical protein
MSIKSIGIEVQACKGILPGMAVMPTARCELCGSEEKSLLRVNHKEHGKIKICNNCLQREASNLLSQSGCCCN